jgi:hypothetical protein
MELGARRPARLPVGSDSEVRVLVGRGLGGALQLGLPRPALRGKSRRQASDLRPPLDAVSRQAIEDQDPHPERAVVPPDPDTTTTDGGGDGPDTLLWVALMLAPPDGTTVPDLMAETGMSRPATRKRAPRSRAPQRHPKP